MNAKYDLKPDESPTDFDKAFNLATVWMFVLVPVIVILTLSITGHVLSAIGFSN